MQQVYTMPQIEAIFQTCQLVPKHKQPSLKVGTKRILQHQKYATNLRNTNIEKFQDVLREIDLYIIQHEGKTYGTEDLEEIFKWFKGENLEIYQPEFGVKRFIYVSNEIKNKEIGYVEIPKFFIKLEYKPGWILDKDVNILKKELTEEEMDEADAKFNKEFQAKEISEEELKKRLPNYQPEESPDPLNLNDPSNFRGQKNEAKNEAKNLDENDFI